MALIKSRKMSRGKTINPFKLSPLLRISELNKRQKMKSRRRKRCKT